MSKLQLSVAVGITIGCGRWWTGRCGSHHAQAEGAVDASKKGFARLVASIARKQGEVWFGDEARVGQKNKITRSWAARGTGASAPQDQRTAST